jgi:hypothetical protein
MYADMLSRQPYCHIQQTGGHLVLFDWFGSLMTVYEPSSLCSIEQNMVQ